MELIKKKKSGHTHELSLSEDFYDYFSVSEEERNPVPGLNEEIQKKIEDAEEEVERGEKSGISEKMVEEKNEEEIVIEDESEEE